MVDKMVKEADLIAVKKGAIEREKRLREQIEDLNRRVVDSESRQRQAESQLKIAKTNLDDDVEVKSVREYLLSEDARLKQERQKYQDDLTSFDKRERGVRAKELHMDLQSKGVEIDLDSLLGAEDMEGESHRIFTEFLVKQNEELKKGKGTSPAESVFESGAGASTKKQPKDMTTPEFAEHVRTLKQMALSETK